MSDKPDPESPGTDDDLEREVRSTRKFSLNEAIGRLAGGDFMKDGTPVSRKRQAELDVDDYLRRHLASSGGVLRGVLVRHLSGSLLKADYDQPRQVLAEYIRGLLTSAHALEQFVRETDAEWGRVHAERPHFQKPGQPPDPDDPYTLDSVRLALSQLGKKLASGEP
jgi:hypothetical protein